MCEKGGIRGRDRNVRGRCSTQSGCEGATCHTAVSYTHLITKAAAEKALSAILGAVVSAVAKGDSVMLVGFGTFKPASRAERIGKNPKTGVPLTIAASTVPRFTAGTAFKAAVSTKKATQKK